MLTWATQDLEYAGSESTLGLKVEKTLAPGVLEVYPFQTKSTCGDIATISPYLPLKPMVNLW